jgi:hypothetical protein
MWYTSTQPRNMRKIDQWVVREQAKGNLRAAAVGHALLEHRTCKLEMAQWQDVIDRTNGISYDTPVVPTSFEDYWRPERLYAKASMKDK